MKLKNLLEKKGLNLKDHEGKNVTTFDMYGNTYEVVEVIDTNSVLAIGPDGEEEEYDLSEIIDQDDDVAGIK